MTEASVTCSAAVEGDVDESVLRRAAQYAGLAVERVYGRKGKPHLKAGVSGYNSAAKHEPWLVLVDLDDDECPASLRQEWLPEQTDYMCLRVAVREVEAWLLADARNAAPFLGVSKSLLPKDADSVADPKATLVRLARRSRWRPIREGLVPLSGSGRQVGPLYVTRLRAFAAERWDPVVAAERSESLGRSLTALRELRESWLDKGVDPAQAEDS